MSPFNFFRGNRNQKLFTSAFRQAELSILSAEPTQARMAQLMAAAGNLAAISAVDAFSALKKEWGRGSERSASAVSCVFGLAFLAMSLSSKQVAEEIKTSKYKGGVEAFAKDTVGLMASAFGEDRSSSWELYREFEQQASHDVAYDSMSLPMLIYFHLFCGLRDIDAAGFWPGNDGTRMPLPDELMPLQEPAHIHLIIRVVKHGIAPEVFLPQRETAVITPLMAELMNRSLTVARSQTAS